MRAFIVILFVFVSSQTAIAEVCGAQNYDGEDMPDFDCPSPDEEAFVPDLTPPPSVPVEAGAYVRVEWEGALVHRDRLIEVGLRLSAVRRLRWADRLRLRAEYDIRAQYAEEVCDARILHARAVSDEYQSSLNQANDRISSSQAWYRSFSFGFVIGFIASGLLVALSIYLGVSL